jgi:predicted dehydrogenase
VEVATQHNTLLVPVFPRRFEACFVAVKDYLQSGALGALRQARCEWSLPYAEGVPLENGVDDLEEDTLVQSLLCQSVDCGRFWFGEALSVSADVAAFRAENRVSMKPVRHEGSVANLIVVHEQATVSYALSRSRATLPGERYTFSGNQGQLELIAQSGVQHPTFAAPSLVLHTHGRSVRLPLQDTQGNEERMPSLLRGFTEGVRSHNFIEPNAADASAALEIVHAAYRSTIENAKITVPLRHSASFEAFFRRFETTRRLTED